MTLRAWFAAAAITLVAAGACATHSPYGAAALECCAADGMRVAEQYRVPAITARRFTQEQLHAAMEPALRSPVLRVTPIGESVQGRPLRAVTFGSGPVTVLLWSQMHGDEATATMSLADIAAWFADTGRADPLRERIARALTVVMVPMLNPDGAALFQRENALGIDINRDARRLVTPEAQALKRLRDSIGADFGFNLHDQNARTLTGPRGRQVAIALLAPAADSARSWGDTRTRARHVAAVVAGVLEREIGGRVARYDDSFEPRAFGDLMQQWGTSTVLIESGAMAGDPEKQRLRAINVVALLSALDAIATGSYATVPTLAYDRLSTNSRSALDLVIRGGSIVVPGHAPVRADVAINYDEAVQREGPRIRDIGDLEAVVALDTVDATGLFLHADSSSLMVEGPRRWLRIGAPGAFIIRRGAAPASEVVRTIGMP